MHKSRPKFSDEFKQDAVRQVTERGYTVKDVAERLGIGNSTLQRWKKEFQQQNTSARNKNQEQDALVEIAHLKAELRRVTEERDILKKAAAYFAKLSQ